MGLFSSLRKSVVSAVFPVLVLCSASSQATTVQFQTSLGNIDVVLFDKTTPKTVENFFYYLNAGAYTDGVIHRSATVLDTNKVERRFVIQGGSYRYTGDMPLANVKTKDSVVNEPLYSNVRGTISMAKLADSPDSATSGWFFNIEDNNSVLDRDNGGYTVFGQVTPESLAVLDQIAAVKTFFVTSSPEFPLRNYTVDDYRNNVPVDENNLVLITNIVVLDPSPNTQDAVTPVENPYYEPPAEELDKDSGGGVLGWYLLALCVLIFTGFRRKTLG
jgi:peptidyl-prolyl cis-trans isomerase A (cyclophilin A)